jgi:cell division protein FtsA
MARPYACGIDIGTHEIKAVIAEEVRQTTPAGDRIVPRVIGQGLAESRGLEHGYITNSSEVARSIRQAVAAAEKASGIEVKRAFVSIGGVGLSGVAVTGSVAISRADLEVTDLDIQKAQEAAEAAIPEAFSLNRKIINTIPIEAKLDGKAVYGRIEGMKAGKLDIKVLFITCLEHHLEDLILAVEEAGIEVVDVVAAPIAASFVTLSKKQKKAGCVLANIGSETLSIVVFENGNPISLEIFQIGGQDLTHDIALGIKVPLEEAEAIKLGSVTRTSFPKKKLDEIIHARLSDCFELVETHLKKIQRNALLPAGIILTGGGAGTAGLKELAESELKLPASIASIHFGDVEKNGVRDGIWAVAYGLAILGFNAENEKGSVGIKKVEDIAIKGKNGLKILVDWFGKFLP